MSLSKTTLSAIQQAGQALHKATVVVAGAVREQAEHMVATVASQPFQVEGEQAFANFKMLARLSQELLALEEQLKGLYATASELASPVMDVVAAIPNARARAAAPNDVAEDAVVKPASVRSAKRTTRKPAAKPASQTAARSKAQKAAKPVALTANDTKVLDYLKTVLKAGEWLDLTGASVAQGAAMPLGSVGISLKKVVASGAVKKRGRGSYQIAA
ncbi:MAG: hypothetical protein HXX19_15355 [Rhodoferax sp.]|nr:hypothetical protein [Rhodoferax sp.]